MSPAVAVTNHIKSSKQYKTTNSSLSDPKEIKCEPSC